MTIEDVKVIIRGDETRILEIKKTTGELKDGMRSACAFLNTAGGWLFFGIAPTTLKILGQEVTDNTRKEIARECRFRIPKDNRCMEGYQLGRATTVEQTGC